jgi:primosomal protein N'
VREKDLICPACKTEMWHPTHCPTCNKKTLSKKGIGIDHVKDTLQERFPNKVHATAEKMGKIPAQFDSLLVSEQGLRSYELAQSPKVDLMIDLCADYHFLDESYACDEKGRYKLIRLLHLAKDLRADSFIQSYQEPRIRSIIAKNWYKDELALRQEHNCPPYGTELRIESKINGTKTLRIVDKNELLAYLTTFRSKAGKDTITVVPQIESYERLTSPK